MYEKWLKELLHLVEEAGVGIMDYYFAEEELVVTQKNDNSVLTEADLCAHNILVSGLQMLTPDIPVLSEEGMIEPYEFRKQWSRYWLIDPLDGTRAFINHQEEFTINVALIEGHSPVLGVLYVPAKKLAYYAIRNGGAFRKDENGHVERIHAASLDWSHVRVLFGYYGVHVQLPNALKELPQCEVLHLNSAWKFGRVAEGMADIYPRLGETSEWDTAAAQCVLEEAGGAVVNLEGDVLQYNTKPALTNPPFLAVGDAEQLQSILVWINEHRRKP